MKDDILDVRPPIMKRDGGYAWYALAVLTLGYTLSFIDRQILVLLVKPIRESLHISDLQFSALHGLAFALFYTTLGLPIGRLVDGHRRTAIIAGGVALWSAMTVLCGLARNFWQLFFARVGVGCGEATMSPAAYSMLADYFTPVQLPRALSIYTGAAQVGAGLALIVGGGLVALAPPIDLPVLGHLETWQTAFLAVGLPGLPFALWVLSVREPQRFGVGTRARPTWRQTFSYIGNRRAAYALLILGYSVFSILWNGSVAWLPTMFMRKFGWTPGTVGLRYGLVMLVSGPLGVVMGGTFASVLRRRGVMDANFRIALAALLIASVAGLAGTYATTSGLALGCVSIFILGCAMPWGGAAAAVMEVTPNQMRGQLSAIYLFFLSMCGTGLGPMFVANFTDNVFRRDSAVDRSIACAILIAAPLAAMLLWLARKPYLAALTQESDGNGACSTGNG